MSEQVRSARKRWSRIAPPISPKRRSGEQLRQAREARGLKIADIAQTLKLGLRQVEALEGG